MLAGLQQLPPWLWVAAVIAIAVISAIIIWARRRGFHVTAFEISAGPVKAKLEPEKPAGSIDRPKPASVNISGNKFFGRTKIGVHREGTSISDNLSAGKTEIEVGAKPGPKPKANKGKQGR